MVAGGWLAKADDNALIGLTSWAVAGRYPEDTENPSSAEEAEMALR